MNNAQNHTPDLQEIARQSMLEHGFEPEFPPAVAQQLSALKSSPPPVNVGADVRDMRSLLWSSIDNDTSKDLDQIEVAERLADGNIRVMIGIADVDSFVPKGCPIDLHAAKETTTVYTGVRIFPMLPEELSTGATSLLPDQDRLVIVIEYTVDKNGCILASDLYRAVVRNKAQLTYSQVGPWLEGKGDAPSQVAKSSALEAQLKLQDEAAQALKMERYRHGALNIESVEVQPVLQDEQVVGIRNQEKNRATDLIEDFMIAANGVVARALEDVPSIRRIVKTPERWDRIVQLASQHGTKLPDTPDSKALNDFLTKQKAADPDHFPDLSLAVVKLMGPGEYVLERAGETGEGHFGLAVQDYTHSTAPNRRYADIITQRLVKAKLRKESNPYSESELQTIAQDCTTKENAARKVEREMSKRVAAVAMAHHIGEIFDAIVTGDNEHGTFVRVTQPHAEGMLVRGKEGLDVGDRVRVKLVRTDVEKGFIDFERA